jgi:flagellar basal-body rod protein FlgB
MTDPIFNDAAMRKAQTALDGLALRQQVIGRNLANVDTPDYVAQQVTFEDAMQRAETRPGGVRLATTHARHLPMNHRAAEVVQMSNRDGNSLRADGNNVNVDQELTQMAETGIRYQALSQLISKKLLLLKSIATGR